MDTPGTDSIPAAAAAVKRPACDTCKTRKTRCDRKSPCSSCVALELPCRRTKKSTERRQRVLISDKYTEAVLDVNRKLDNIYASLKSLTDGHPNSTSVSFNSGRDHAPTVLYSQMRTTHEALTKFEHGPGLFRGESSFDAHATRLRDALQRKSGAKHPVGGVSKPRPYDISFSKDETFSMDTDSGSNSPHSAKFRRPGIAAGNANTLQGLPQSDITLKIFHVMNEERQRWFTDMPVITPDEFAEACWNVYFPTSPRSARSVGDWITTNVGLYYIIIDLNPRHYGHVGLTASTVDQQLPMLKYNIFAACQELQIDTVPDFQICRAMAMLSMFCMKTGYFETAWRISSSAIRMCVDLGMHRRGDRDAMVEENFHTVIWWSYSTHQQLALTLSRPPVIRKTDIETNPGDFGVGKHLEHARLYAMFADFPLLIEDINEQLFSSIANTTGHAERVARACDLESRLLHIHQELKQANRDEPDRDIIFLHAAVMLEIVLHSLLALVQYPRNPDPTAPLQYSEACIMSSRNAVEALVEIGRLCRPAGWAMFLNITFSMVPPIPLLVLIGNGLTTGSNGDMALVDAAMELMHPVAANSPGVSAILQECRSLTRMFKTISEAFPDQHSAHTVTSVR